MGASKGGSRRRAAYAIAGAGLAGLAGALLPLFLPRSGEVLSLLAGASFAALFASAALASGGRRRQAREREQADDLEALAGRLAKLEGQVGGLDSAGARTSTAIGDVSSDLQSLGEVVRSLAEALSVQDRELVGLRRSAARLAVPPAPQADPERGVPTFASAPVVPSFFPGARSGDAEMATTRSSAGSVEPTDPETILRAVLGGHVDAHAQPVVTLPQRRPCLYDLYVLLRLPDHQVLVPGQYLPVLEREGRRADLERLVLSLALDAADRLKAGGHEAAVTCSLSAASLGDGSAAGRLGDLLEAKPDAARRLVLEMPQAAWAGREGGETARALRELGATIALSHVDDRLPDGTVLAAAGIRFVRVPAERLVAAAADPSSRLASLPGALAAAGVALIADRVEDERAVPELIDIGTPLAQGFIFSLPVPLAALVATPPLGQGSAAAERRPFRATLRRAG